MYKKMQLKNGMKVLFVESHKSPVVSIQMWVKTGSADEAAKERGISHFIEHLVFKGTEKFEVGEIAKIVEASGGELNAYTSFDQTVFYVTISKEFLETGLDVISQMMGFPQFDEEEIDNEREVVIEEIKRGMDNPHRQASQLLFSTMYKKHPYKFPVIGYEKIIQNVKKSTLVDYYHRRYVPENMTLIIAGDVKSSEIKGQVKDYFGSFEDYQLDKVKRVKDEKQLRPRIKVEESAFKENISYIAWPTPKVTHKDTPALDVLSVVLGHGASSRLIKALRVESSLVNYVGASSYSPQDDGFFTISFSANEENLKEAYDGVQEQIFKMLEEGISEEELAKAKVSFESDEYYSLETVDGLAKKVGYYNFLFNDHKYFEEYLKQVQALTTKDIYRVAKKYLKPDKINHILCTTEKSDELRVHLKNWVKQYKKSFEALKPLKFDDIKSKRSRRSWKVAAAKNSEGEIKTLKSGAKVLLLPSKDTPVFTIKAASLGGVRAESTDMVGLSELYSRVWGSATESMTEEEVYNFVDNNASSLSAFGGRNTVGLSMTTLVPFANPMLDMYFDALLNPVFDDSIIAREKIMMNEHIKKRDDNPAQTCVHQFMKAMFGNHPYSQDPYGTQESLDTITADELRAYKENFVTTKNTMFVVAGQFDKAKIISKLEEQTSKLPSGSVYNKAYEFSPPTEQVVEHTELDKEQSHLILGFPAYTFLDKKRYALEVIQSVLAGQGGRLFLELRDKNSLAYSVSPLKMEGIDAGYFGAYIGCSPEKTNKALEMMRAEFSKLMTTKVSSQELDAAKRYIIGRHDIGLQKTSAIANNALFDAIYGVTLEESGDYANIIRSVTAEEVQAVAKEIFSQPEVISIVGPKV